MAGRPAPTVAAMACKPGMAEPAGSIKDSGFSTRNDPPSAGRTLPYRQALEMIQRKAAASAHFNLSSHRISQPTCGHLSFRASSNQGGAVNHEGPAFFRGVRSLSIAARAGGGPKSYCVLRRRHSRGEKPVQRRNARVKFAESVKPNSNATFTTFDSGCSNAFRAISKRV